MINDNDMICYRDCRSITLEKGKPCNCLRCQGKLEVDEYGLGRVIVPLIITDVTIPDGDPLKKMKERYPSKNVKKR